MTDTIHSDPTRVEKRYRRLSLIALVFIAPLAVFLAGREDRAAYGASAELRPVEVAAGQTVEYNGAQIRLVRAHVSTNSFGLPPDRTMLRARYEATLSRHDPLSWSDCRLNLRDQRGREWSLFPAPPAAVRTTMASPGEAEAAEGCGVLRLSSSEVGKPVQFEAYFLVPTDVAGTLRPTLSSTGARPRYLIFPAVGGAQ